MKSYSPYDNLEAKAYAAMLVKTSLDDSQVIYGSPPSTSPAQDHKDRQEPAPLQDRHGRRQRRIAERYDRLKETTFDYEFLFREVRIGK